MEESNEGKSQKWVPIFFVVLIGGFLLFRMGQIVKKSANYHLISPISSRLPVSVKSFVEDTLGFENPLKTIVDKELAGATGEYGVVIKNLKTGELYMVNEHEVFDSASLYKLWIMATAFDQIQNKKLNEDEMLTQNVDTLNDEFDIPPDMAELTDGTVSLSVQSAIERMITISHNYAALLLTEKVKLSSVKSFLEQNGFKESKVGISGEEPTTTAYDIALFYEKLYSGQLAGKENTEKND